MSEATETPMADHVARFFQLLAAEHVRILVETCRYHDKEHPAHWDSSSFHDDVAKAILAALRDGAATPALTEADVEGIADTLDHFDHRPTRVRARAVIAHINARGG